MQREKYYMWLWNLALQTPGLVKLQRKSHFSVLIHADKTSNMKGLMVQVSRTLGRAAPLLRRSIHSGTRPASTATSARKAERPVTSEDIYAREEKYGAHNYSPLPVALERGKGEFLLSNQVNVEMFDQYRQTLL